MAPVAFQNIGCRIAVSGAFQRREFACLAFGTRYTPRMKELHRIMHVEDDPDIREITRMSLELVGGFDVIQFKCGKDAVENLPTEAPDLILLDVMMPVMDGVETLKRLREVAAYAEVPVIFVTAKTSRADFGHLKAVGAQDIILKPFEPMELPGQLLKIWESCQAA
ncbi:response regulator [Celeribacter ethanolicus]|nr:response regulator [Celeribacter ethanolicus]